MIPPLLGFYAKLYVIGSLANTGMNYAAIFIILCSVIGCVRYLNIVQISNMKKNNLITKNYTSISPSISYIIALGTIFITLSFLSPIYIISTISMLLFI